MSKHKNLLARVLTSIFLIGALLVGMFMLPQWLWGLMLILPITMVAVEYSRLFGWDQKLRVGFLLTIVGLCLVPFLLFDQFNELVSVIGMVISWAAVLFWMLLVPFLIRYRFQTKNYICNAVIGILVIAPAWFGMVGLHTYPYALLGVLVGVWLVDIAGYFIGREFGKIKLLPSVSPGKTREGVLGGFVSVCVYGLGLSLAFEHVFTMAQWILFVIIVFAFTAIAVLGDLFESFLKRSSGVKDSGSILPGHGGMLDRVDSMTALLPFSFLVIQMFVS
jgi:phosphatidate cytidylyltransferase